MSMRAKLWSIAGVSFLLGGLTVSQMPFAFGQGVQPKGPKWQYGLSIKVRKAEEADFGKDTKRVGLEVYKDENNGNLIYVSESGAIAVTPAR